MTEQDFDWVIEAVGKGGEFQRRFALIFNFALAVVSAMQFHSIIYALAVPEHWCFVPGRENTNYSLQQWKAMHLPRKDGSDFDNCRMNNSSGPSETPSIIRCQSGWEFDKTWYETTVPAQDSWVCDDILLVTHAFAFNKLGELIGTLIYGHLADAVGRRPVFFANLASTVCGSFLAILTARSAPLFFLSIFIGNLSSTALYTSTLIISMEMSKKEYRARLAMVQCLGWSVGVCLLPFVMWLLRDWSIFLLIMTVPCIIYMLSGKLLIESPRWLASKGQTKRCIRELEKIAKTNGTTVSSDVILALVETKHDKVYGIVGLLSSWRLIKNCLLLTLSWSTTLLIYDTQTLNINNLAGNPFVNFFWQGLVQFPAACVARYCSDKFGRRWTHIGGFLATFLGCVPILFIINDKSKEILVASICNYLKFAITFCFYVVNLEGLEIYPTCVRQSGLAVGGLIANAFGILAPYVVFVETEIEPSFMYILSAVLSLLGATCGLFLPETLNHKLPETLAEAAIFGAQQDFWGRTKKRASEQPLSMDTAIVD